LARRRPGDYGPAQEGVSNSGRVVTGLCRGPAMPPRGGAAEAARRAMHGYSLGV
jgi:hypothetical protein